MSMNSIPEKVDCIIIGTGLTNSILAAACSRIGKSVLHVDKENYYGNEYASFTFHQLIDWIKLKDPNNSCVRNEKIPQELNSKSRMFCLDLCPRLLYSDGAMVKLLVKSNVSRYHEFKNNIRVLSMLEDEIHVMPCRRSDVFTSDLLTDLIDKRRLMKFVELCIKYDEEDECPETLEVNANANRSIEEFLKERGLKDSLRYHIINSIAMVTPNTGTQEACKKIKQFMVATERFGKSPFLFPLYGCGEYPQSFCRLSAVYGGTYCLNTDAEQVDLPKGEHAEMDDNSTDDKSFSVKLSSVNHNVRSDTLIVDHHVAARLNLNQGDNLACCDMKVSRCILITRQSILQNEANLLSILRIPASSETDTPTVHLLELNSSIAVCPPEINIVYLWCRSSGRGAEADLAPVVKRVYAKCNDDAIMWQYYYHSATDGSSAERNDSKLRGFYVTSPPSGDIDYSAEIEEAEAIFKGLYPGEEFLPRAPDPDELIN